jgi:iron complex outermembrane recepter protein
VTSRLFGPRRMDNDQINQQPLIPGEATIDVKLAGQYDRFFWSASVLNLLDKHYYDYAIASGGIAGGPFFPPGLPPTIGLFNAFPLAGRTFLLQAGATF